LNRQERRRQRKQQQKSDPVASGIAPNVTTDTHLKAASVHLGAGRFEEAAELCQEAIAGAPLDAEPYHLLALIRYRQGRIQDAGENILEAITRNETNPDLHANCGAIMNMLGRHAEAEAACRHAITLKPKNAEAHSNLAVAVEMQGRLEEAKEICEQALRLNPNYPEALINLGNLHVRQGSFVSGVESYVKAIQLAPENPTSRANLSVALLRLGEHEEALKQAGEALDLNPDYVEALNALGNALSATGELKQAEEVFKKAHAIQPAHREAGINLAATQHKSGRSADALATYQNILKTSPGLAEAENGLGVVLLAQGEIDEAGAAFRRAIEINPGLAGAYYNLASSSIVLKPQEISEIQTLLDNPVTSDEQKISLHFALADHAGQEIDVNSHISHLNAGNDLRRSEMTRNEIDFDPDDLDRDIASIKEVFSVDLISRLQGIGDTTDHPVFVCGMPRSGTTLVEQISSSHPKVRSVGEIGIIGELLDDYPNDVEGLNAERAGALCQTVIDKMPAGNGQRIINKSPFNFFYLGLIQILLPNARVIHCTRDSMDVGLSCYAQNFVSAQPWSTDLGDIGRYIRGESRIMDHWRSVLSLPILEVAYEDVIAGQEIESRRIIEFLGLPWDEACLSFYDNRQTVLTASNWQVRKPLYSSSVGKARAYGDHLKALKVALAG
jgi:tetratricopeptide (TPR) repeat protein